MFLDTQSAPSMVFAVIPLILWQNEDMSTRQELWVHPVHISVTHQLFTPLTPFIPWDLSKEETPRGEKALGLGSDSPWSMPTFAWSPAVWPWTAAFSEPHFLLGKKRHKIRSTDGKDSTCSEGDPGSIPGSVRSSVEGNGNPLQYPCLENPKDWGSWWATVHGVSKSRTQLSN